MWDLRIYHPFGRLSTRKIFARAATLFVALFAYILLFTPNAYAVDATFNGGNITYEGETYNGPITSKPDGTDAIPENAQIYRANSGNNGDVAKFLYFPEGSDPAQANQANFIQYNYDADSLEYSNPNGQQSVAISASDNAAANANGGDPNAPDGSETTCAVSGIGWIVCPISNFIADGIDLAYEQLKYYVEVQPLGLANEGSLYEAWDIMRGFANVAFVAAFLIIIYSHLTNFGLSNYGMKQMIPRLIVAAILVNVSYYICAIAIDLSNITGVSLQQILMGLRDQLFEIGPDSAINNLDWRSAIEFVISGGALGGAAFLALGATGGSIIGASAMLIPVAAMAMLVLLSALIVLAARQAIIVMLVILAPLAFVAYLLPGTEKWFKRWTDTFVAMMVFFPFFSLLFGGAQFAGSIIIQNATSFFMILFGLTIQVLPLILLPTILKFGSTLVNRIAGMVDNPKRGLIDRARNFANDTRDMRRNKSLSGPMGKRNFARRTARGIDRARQKREHMKVAYKQQYDAHVAKDAATLKKRQKIEVDLQLAKLRTENWQSETNRAVNELRAGNTDSFMRLQATDNGGGKYDPKFHKQLMENRSNMVVADTENRILREANKAAEIEQQARFAGELINDQQVQMAAGGMSGARGAERALSAAISQERSDYLSRVKEKEQLFKHLNLDSNTKQQLALGQDKDGNAVDEITINSNGMVYKFNTSDDFTREAAIMDRLKAGSFDEIEDVIKETGNVVADSSAPNGTREGRTYAWASTVADEIVDRKLAGKAIYLGAQTINEVGQGLVSGDRGLDFAATRIVDKGKISASALSEMNANAIKRFNDTLEQVNRYTASEYKVKNATVFQDNVTALKKTADEVLGSDILRRNADANSLRELQRLSQLNESAVIAQIQDDIRNGRT